MRLVLLVSLTLASYGYQQNQPPRRTVTGMVSNSVTGEPIRHALVQLSGPRAVSVLTGDDGRFEIADVPEGPASFVVTKPGFFDSRFLPAGEWKTTGPMFIVGSGKNDFRLTLIAAARIVGRLTGSDDEPLERTQVQVLTEQIVKGHKQWQARNASKTDDDGSYHMEDLLPGHYVVFAMGHALAATSWEAPPQVIAPAYYPNARDLAAAQRIDLQPGQEFRADFHLRPERGFRVTGHVSGIPAGRRMALSLENSSGQTVYLQGQDVDSSRGQFTLLAVPSGSWTLTMSANDSEGHAYQARQLLTVDGADLNNVEMQLHPASIPVTINSAASQRKPLPDLQLGPPGASLELISEGGANLRTYELMSRGDGDSVLFFDDVAEGKYKLDVQSYGSECLESAWYGSVNLSDDYLVVTSGGATQPLTVNLRGDCASLSAQIAPGQNQASGFLVIVPSSSFAEPKVLPIMAQSFFPAGMPFGGMSITLAPGTYRVFAFTNLDHLEYANPEALRDYPSQTITLDPRQKLELPVKLIDRKGS